MPEVLLAFFRLVDGDGEVNLFDVCRHLAEVDFDLFVVAFARTGEVVAHVFDGAALMLEVAVENEIVIVTHFAVRAEHEDRAVEVEIFAAVVLVCIPAEPD